MQDILALQKSTYSEELTVSSWSTISVQHCGGGGGGGASQYPL